MHFTGNCWHMCSTFKTSSWNTERWKLLWGGREPENFKDPFYSQNFFLVVMFPVLLWAHWLLCMKTFLLQRCFHISLLKVEMSVQFPKHWDPNVSWPSSIWNVTKAKINCRQRNLKHPSRMDQVQTARIYIGIVKVLTANMKVLVTD